jgi:hypothetical protein
MILEHFTTQAPVAARCCQAGLSHEVGSALWVGLAITVVNTADKQQR